MIKRIVTVMLAVALLAALALPAVADAFTLYVTKDGVKGLYAVCHQGRREGVREEGHRRQGVQAAVQG